MPNAALQRLVEQVLAAREHGAPLDIRGGGSKAFYGQIPCGQPLPVAGLAGISSYEPTELVVTARAGTALAELEAALAENRQHLPFEPPRFAANGTLGGMVAAGLAGPARGSVGGVRDYVLGISLLNGRGELLRFGGQVIKNVAGYDLSRLLTGSMGVLGVICEVSLKVMPLPSAETTVEMETGALEAIKKFSQWRGLPLPISATSWYQGLLRARLSGAQAAVQAATAALGGRILLADEAVTWWARLRDHRHAFFMMEAAALAQGECLWRLSMPATSTVLPPVDELLIEWAGALRWWRTSLPVSEVRTLAAKAGGHATLFYRADNSVAAFTPLPDALMRIHRNLKAAFDPHNIFNRGRLYPDL